MIIDFHAHIYPAKIAEKASDTIGQFYNIQMKYKGSPESLLESGSRIGVDRYIVHSTATAPHQVESINNYIIGEVESHPEFIGFGTIHPEYENYENELIRIYSAGLMGIKLHPDFQKFPIDLREMDDIYEVIAGLKMPILVHAGDYRYDYSGPKRIAHVLEKHPTLKVVAAHFGGYTQWEDSEKYLVGKNVWFDTSSSLWKLTPDEAMRMIRNHGVEKMLFGVDYPMWDHQEELERFNKLPLSEEERDAILYKNAVDLLGL